MPKTALKRTLMLGAALGVAAPATMALTEQAAIAAPTCGAGVQNPHHSDGANGVISKTDFVCYYVPANGAYVSYNLLLWLCPSEPPQSENYLAGYCSQVGNASGTIYGMAGGQAYTRYVPPSGVPGVKGTGWYMACASWSDSGGVYHMDYSNAVFICEK